LPQVEILLGSWQIKKGSSTASLADGGVLAEMRRHRGQVAVFEIFWKSIPFFKNCLGGPTQNWSSTVCESIDFRAVSLIHPFIRGY
jgi:hypothetical protein